MKHPAAAALGLLVLAACGGGGNDKPLTTTTTTSVVASTTTSGAPASTTTTAAAATVAPGPGTITLTLRAPAAFNGTVRTSVVCTNERGHYAAEASSFPVNDLTGSMSVNIAGYGGPRRYSTEVTVEFLQPNGISDKLTAVVPIMVANPQQGSFSISGTDDRGQRVDADFGWWCS